MQDTIFKVKADLGSEALILDTRKYKKGGFLGFFGKKQVEILAGLEEENGNERTIQEINDLKNMISNLSPGWKQDYGEKYFALPKYLIAAGVKQSFIDKIINNIPEQVTRDKELVIEAVSRELLNMVGEASPIETDRGQRVIFFTGPTGVGKTTTIAKLTAIMSLQRKKRVALITTDTYRIAAVQQLSTYSEIVNVPLEVVYNKEGFEDLLTGKFADYDLILVDTAGTSWNDDLHLGKLKDFTSCNYVDEIHLLVGLNTKSSDIRSIIEKFSQLNPDKLILTKLDETTNYGDILNIREEFKLPYSYITYGQNVPEDIEIAGPDALVKYILSDYDV